MSRGISKKYQTEVDNERALILEHRAKPPTELVAIDDDMK